MAIVVFSSKKNKYMYCLLHKRYEYLYRRKKWKITIKS